MKNIRMLFLVMSIFFMSLLAGCDGDEDKIIGYWKSVEEQTYATHSKIQVYVISNNSVTIDDEGITDDMIWEEKDGKIFGKSETSPFEKIEIQILDENRIAIWRKNVMTSANADGDEFVRTTEEDVEAIIKSTGRKHEYEPIKLF